MSETPVVAKSVRYSPIVHECYPHQRVAWCVMITELDGSESYCHGDGRTNMGHKTKHAAAECVKAEMRRRVKKAMVDA